MSLEIVCVHVLVCIHSLTRAFDSIWHVSQLGHGIRRLHRLETALPYIDRATYQALHV